MSKTSERATSTAEQASETLVEVDGLKKYYGEGGRFSGPPVKAVDGVSFSIEEGETLGLVGESGSGKTTLGRTLIQLETATEGSVSFSGQDITKLSGDEIKQWRKNAQIVFQDPESSLNDRMTVGEIIREPLDAHNWKSPKERREKVRDLLSSVGLQEDHYFRYPHQFSGGQRQRIGIARALALEPDFLVLDEPVSALDASVQAKILNLLEDLQTEFGLTYLFIAHDLSVVRHICDRVAVMYLGKIMEIGDTEELYSDTKNPYTKSLLSAIPRPDPASERTRITLPGTPPSPRDPPEGCQFSTRCPAKIRPDAFADLSDDTWDAIEQFREVVRERTRLDIGIRGRAKRQLGVFSDFDDVEEAAAELFGGIETPPEVDEAVDEAIEQVKDGYPDQARKSLKDTFGGVCDTERPETYPVSESGRLSYCHRHSEEYADVDTTLARRLDDT